jgi:hypothetical protein
VKGVPLPFPGIARRLIKARWLDPDFNLPIRALPAQGKSCSTEHNLRTSATQTSAILSPTKSPVGTGMSVAGFIECAAHLIDEKTTHFLLWIIVDKSCLE